MGVRGELFSIVVSDCFDAVSERQEHACAGLHDKVRVLVRQFGELGVFGGSLDMRHDNAFVIGADNRVGLPVSDAAFCGDNRRPLIDIDAVRNQPAPRILALAPVVFFAAVTQVKIQRAPVFLVFPDMLIDALVTDKGDAILRQTPADLIGTSLLLRQFFFDQLHQIWRHFARLVRGLFASLRGLLVRLLEAIAARAGVANKLAADRRRIDANLPRDVGLRVAALQERVNLAALFAGQMEIAFGHFSSVRCAVPRKDSLHLTARKTGIHNMAKSGGRKRRPQGCSLRSHRLQRLKPLTPTLSPATHSAMPSMLPCCTSDLKRRKEFASHAQIATSLGALSYFAKPYHSWERGLNEHTNGLFRQYFPKGSDLSILSDADVQRVEDKLNSRPRKILGYQTPREIFFSARNLPVALHC